MKYYYEQMFRRCLTNALIFGIGFIVAENIRSHYFDILYYVGASYGTFYFMNAVISFFLSLTGLYLGAAICFHFVADTEGGLNDDLE